MSQLARFNGASLTDLPSDLQEWDWESGVGPFLWGGYGAGKTHAAVAMTYHKVWGMGVPRDAAPFINMAQLFTDKRKAMDDKDTGFREPNWKTIQFAVLDDIDKLRMSDWVREEMFCIIDMLWGRQVPIIITSNMNPREFAGHMTGAITSRLKDMVRSYHMQGPDRRGIS